MRRQPHQPPVGGAAPAARGAALRVHAAASLAVLILCGCGASAGLADRSATTGASGAAPRAATATTTPSRAEAPCGAASTATVAQTVGEVARRIYLTEVSSAEVSADRRQVEGDSGLLSALAAGDRAGVAEAVRRLVYSGTHIVRLRVSTGATVLADVGGPYILAPVGGSLRVGGRVVGRYVLSVQDDLGYVKLETRFIGLPMTMRAGGRRIPVEGVIAPPSPLPQHGLVSYAGKRYQTVSVAASAFPAGPLTITVLVPVAQASSASCAVVRATELGRIAHTVWNRVSAIGASPSALPSLAGGLTGGLLYVRAGGRQLAGSTSPGPGRIPASGRLVYRGRSYLVTSFAARAGGQAVRVYQLTPA
ncbi:MAG TPA: hypothetical protein VF380_09465 [Solirubrobacteraceae bacterium]